METLKITKTKLAILMIIGILVISHISYANAYKSITNRGKGVTVDARPVQLAKGKQIQFQVRINTHAVELDQDMVAVSELKDDEGKIYKPINWQGSPPGGHHRKGVLEFPILEGSPGSVALIIRDIANVSKRVFEWKID
ncbi:hypothetical protein ACFL1Z_04595 [Thermodesulfobacteriota bacterium]